MRFSSSSVGSSVRWCFLFLLIWTKASLTPILRKLRVTKWPPFHWKSKKMVVTGHLSLFVWFKETVTSTFSYQYYESTWKGKYRVLFQNMLIFWNTTLSINMFISLVVWQNISVFWNRTRFLTFSSGLNIELQNESCFLKNHFFKWTHIMSYSKYPFPLQVPQCLVPLQTGHVTNFFVSLPVNVPVSTQYSPLPPQDEQIRPPLQLGHTRL